MTEGRTYEGSCLCGAVTYAFEGPISDVVCCHCTQCRKQSGHHFAAIHVSRDRFRLSGESNLSWYQSSEDARRGFCRNCGSVLLWENVNRDNISVMAGGVDGPLGVGVEAHLYVDDKGDYYEICGDARQYSEAS